MCRWAGVSRSGYYSWRERKNSSGTTRRKNLAVLVRREFEASDGAYGYRRVTAALERQGVSVCQDTVRAVMREQSLKGRATAPGRPRTTVPADDLGERPDLVRPDLVRPDLVRRDFTAKKPGIKWVGDITCVRTWAGFVYLPTVPGCCTRKVVGDAMADPRAHRPGL